MHPFLRHSVVFGITSFLGVRAARAQSVTYTDLYTLGKPATATGYFGGNPTGYEEIQGGQSVGGGYGSFSGYSQHALLWNNSSASTDLNPTTSSSSTCQGVNGGYQVGYGSVGGSSHAFIWHNTAASATDLNPTTGYTGSAANGVGGGQEVGYGTSTADSNSHALLWTGTSNVAIDLNPLTFTSSVAFGTDGMYQVGSGLTGSNTHALFWHGTSSSTTDLQPTSGFSGSVAYAVGGGEEVGSGNNSSTGNSDALVWIGASNGAVDLSPGAGFGNSQSYGTDGTHQVGYARTTGGNSVNHAMYWSGSSGSFVDLQLALPSNLTSSTAYSISGNNVFGIAQDSSYAYHAVEWTVSSAPEPTSFLTFTTSMVALCIRRRRVSTQN